MIATPEAPEMRDSLAAHAKDFSRLSPGRDFHHDIPIDRTYGHFVSESGLRESYLELRNDVVPAPLERWMRPDMDIHEKVARGGTGLSRRAAPPHGERLPVTDAGGNLKGDPLFLLQTPRAMAFGAFLAIYLAPAVAALAYRHLGERPEDSLHRVPYLPSALAISARLFFRVRFSARALADAAP